jgi:hypothetical protein
VVAPAVSLHLTIIASFLFSFLSILGRNHQFVNRKIVNFL